MTMPAQFVVEILDMKTGRVSYAAGSGDGLRVSFTRIYRHAALWDEDEADEQAAFYRQLLDDPQVYVHVVAGGCYACWEDMQFNELARIR